MNIAGFIKTSLIEWPGRVSAVVFTPGCNFRCPFCHNRELVLLGEDTVPSLGGREVRSFAPLSGETGPSPPAQAGKPQYPTDEVLADLKTRQGWLDAVCITGGEPTLQPGLGDFLASVKELGLATMVETNGSSPGALESLLQNGLASCVAMDLKGPLTPGFYGKVGAGSLLNNVLRSVDILRVRSSRSDLLPVKGDLIFRTAEVKDPLPTGSFQYHFRTTVVPTLHDLHSLQLLAGSLQAGETWFLQTFRPQNCLDPVFDDLEPYSAQEMQDFLQALSSTTTAHITLR